MTRHHPIVAQPEGTPHLDLSRGPVTHPPAWYVGRYDEVRPSQYPGEAFAGRTLHVGVDLGAPAGTSVHAFEDGKVLHAAVNPGRGDYGPTLVCEHVVEGALLWVLLGHLSLESLGLSPVGRRFARGEVLGWLGRPEVNGGWAPHVHVQLATERPARADLPGVVAPADREAALLRFPDPSRIMR